MEGAANMGLKIQNSKDICCGSIPGDKAGRYTVQEIITPRLAVILFRKLLPQGWPLYYSGYYCPQAGEVIIETRVGFGDSLRTGYCYGARGAGGHHRGHHCYAVVIVR